MNSSQQALHLLEKEIEEDNREIQKLEAELHRKQPELEKEKREVEKEKAELAKDESEFNFIQHRLDALKQERTRKQGELRRIGNDLKKAIEGKKAA